MSLAKLESCRQTGRRPRNGEIADMVVNAIDERCRQRRLPPDSNPFLGGMSDVDIATAYRGAVKYAAQTQAAEGDVVRDAIDLLMWRHANVLLPDFLPD